MGKKRRAWWIVGGAVCFVVIFFVTAFLVSWTSPNARLDRALSGIITEYGFEYMSESLVTGMSEHVTFDTYEAAPISQEDERRILAQLKEASPSGTVAIIEVDTPKIFYTSTPDPRFDILVFTPPDRSYIRSIAIEFQAVGQVTGGVSPLSEMRVTLIRNDDPGSFLKSLWPW